MSSIKNIFLLLLIFPGCATTLSPPSHWEYLNNIPRHVWADTKDTFSQKNADKILLLSLSTAAWANESEDARDYYSDRGGVAVDLGNDYLGQGGFATALSLGVYEAGHIFENKQMSDTGMAMFEGLLQTGLQVQAIKFLAHEKRPNGSNRMSFPSGHAAVYGTVYGALVTMSEGQQHEFIHFLFCTLGAAGAMVAMESRLDSKDHWFHDVGAGFWLGFWNGQRAARRYNPNASDWTRIDDNWAMEPWIDRDIVGIRFHYEIPNK